MGNRNCTAKVSAGSQDGTSDAAEGGSGVFLAQEFQQELIHSFETKILKEQWNKRQSEILKSTNARTAAETQRRLRFESEYNQWKKQNSETHSNLDKDIDEFRARFADAAASLKWDVGKLESKAGKSVQFGKDNACVNARIDVAECLREENDVRKCNEILKIMENCTKQNVVVQQ
mmetsp:Transcript_6815/g.9821  ORF Transcript_6815/g.9821 Transcript_6815/m.9821 type:complete len:175 (+) Transcript_6815:52-576(+)